MHMVNPDAPHRVSEKNVEIDSHAEAVLDVSNVAETHACANIAVADKRRRIALNKTQKALKKRKNRNHCSNRVKASQKCSNFNYATF